MSDNVLLDVSSVNLCMNLVKMILIVILSLLWLEMVQVVILQSE